MNIKLFIADYVDSNRLVNLTTKLRYEKSKHIKNEIVSITGWLPQDAKDIERIWCIHHNILKRPTCEYCNTNECKFINFAKGGYAKYCSNKCQTSNKNKVSNLSVRAIKEDIDKSVSNNDVVSIGTKIGMLKDYQDFLLREAEAITGVLFTDWRQAYYHYISKEKEIPNCLNCNTPLEIQSNGSLHGYSKHCNKKCYDNNSALRSINAVDIRANMTVKQNNLRSKRFVATISKIETNGLSKAQNIANIASITKYNTINEEGLNTHQISSRKAAITQQTTLCENGLSISKNIGRKSAITRHLNGTNYIPNSVSKEATKYIEKFIIDNNIDKDLCLYGINELSIMHDNLLTISKTAKYDLVVFKDSSSLANKDLNGIELVLEYDGPCWHATKTDIKRHPYKIMPAIGNMTYIEKFRQDEAKRNVILEHTSAERFIRVRGGKKTKTIEDIKNATL